MMMERYNYVNPARIKVLVVPISDVTQEQFSIYYEKICRLNEIRLLDITPMADLKFFNPQTFPNGRLLFDFSSSMPDTESIFLHDFEPFRKTFVVLGVGAYSENIDVNLCHELAKLYPSTIVQNCIFFDTPQEDLKRLNQVNDHSIKSFFYPDEHNITSLETIMCDISRNFLFHLDGYAASYQNITLRSPVSITDSQLLSKTITKAQKRISSGSSSLKVQFNGNNGGQVDSKNKGQVRNNGRHSKLLGSFYLLAGKYVDALNSFTDAMLYLRKTDDSMWLASALEGTGVSIVLLNFIDIPYQLPNAVLTAVLSLSKGKIRDMSVDNVARKISNDSNSGAVNGSPNGGRNIPVSPRTSSSSGMSFNIPSGPIGSGPDLSLIAIPELIKQIALKVNHFFQVSTDDFENTVPDVVYIESLLRYIHFMILVYGTGTAIHAPFFETIVKGRKVKVDGRGQPNPWFAKADVMAEVDKIFSLQLVDLNIVDQCRIYSSVASVYCNLGMNRKKAFILRVLVVGLLPKLKVSSGDNDPKLVNFDSVEQDSSIKDLIKLLFSDYGVTAEPEVSIADSSIASKHSWYSIHVQLIKVAIEILEALNDVEALVQVYCLALTRYLHCLPFDDQMRLKVKLETLCSKTPGLSVPYFDPFLVRAVQFANNNPSKGELVPFSGKQKKTGIQSTPTLSFNANKSTNKSKTDQFLISQQTYQLKVTLQNPFLFEVEINDLEIVSNLDVETINNGIRSVSDQTRILNSASALKSNNQSKMSVNNPKIRNGGSSPLNSNSEFFNTGNINGHSSSNSNPSGSLVVPPNSTETFIVPFKPLESGTMVVEGLRISMGICDSQIFPIIADEKSDPSSKIKVFTPAEKDPLESIIQNLSHASNLVNGRANTTSLELNVIDPQPTLAVIEISVTNSWLMLLEGEKRQFSVKLMNQSEQNINYMSFSFWDSTINQLSSYLNNKLSAQEVYEIEWYLMKFKSFRIVNKQKINEQFQIILPGQEVTIEYEVTGKRNMTESKMILEYAHKQDDKPSFLKTVEIPINLTVAPSVEIISFNIVPLSLSTINGFSVQSDLESKNLQELRKFMNSLSCGDSQTISDYCLITVDLRDSWTEELELEVTFDVENKKDPTQFRIHDVLKPRKTIRYFIPVKRLSSTELRFQERIPSLRNKQYIKDYSISDAEDSQMKTAFWLRENILSRIEGSWRNKTRYGDINFRNFKLTDKMVSCLIYPKVKIITEIIKDGEIIKRNGINYELNIEEFYIFRTKITNYSDSAVTGRLRHLPVLSNARDLTSVDKRVLVDGLLQNKLPAALEPNKTLTVDLSFVILERGEYEWGLILDSSNDNETSRTSGREPVYIVAS